jgi:hypothetical protein
LIYFKKNFRLGKIVDRINLEISKPEDVVYGDSEADVAQILYEVHRVWLRWEKEGKRQFRSSDSFYAAVVFKIGEPGKYYLVGIRIADHEGQARDTVDTFASYVNRISFTLGSSLGRVVEDTTAKGALNYTYVVGKDGKASLEQLITSKKAKECFRQFLKAMQERGCYMTTEPFSTDWFDQFLGNGGLSSSGDTVEKTPSKQAVGEVVKTTKLTPSNTAWV